MKNKVIVITGGTRGIGDAISTNMLRHGATVVALAKSKLNNQKWIEDKKQSGFSKAHVYDCDVSNYEMCKEIISDIENKHGKIDILVNNAGITRDCTFRKMEKRSWDEVLNVNLSGLYNVTRPIIDIMIKNNYGRIINISSISGQRGQFGQVNYAAVKAGVHGFTKALALEVAKKNITVNTVSPGFINTEMVKKIPKNILNNIISKIPVGRLGKAEEVANLVGFLASDNSGYITRSDFSINGGL